VLQLYVVGIGAGDPGHVTVQAVEVLNRLDVVLLVDKGEAAPELAQLRSDILARYVPADRRPRSVRIEDPARDRKADAYAEAVVAWREERAARYEAALADLGPDEVAGFLVLGDPSLYDGTLLILDDLLARGNVAFEHHVVPGITSVSALAASHARALNLPGESITITTGRRVAQRLPDDPNIVVMLDGDEAWRSLPDDLHIWWGAFLGTPDEVTVQGRLGDCRDRLAETRSRLKADKGWMFDTYLLRRSP
jgi:precorrin-6A synthase